MELKKIHEDKRGSVHVLTGEPLTVPEISFLTCRAGLARGGCIHEKSRENLTVISGSIYYFWGQEENHKIIHQGESIIIEANTPHYFLALTDCIVIEWGADLNEKQTKYQPFRAIVDEINKTRE